MCISQPFIPVTLFTSCISQPLKIYCGLSLSHLCPPPVPPSILTSPPSFSTFFFQSTNLYLASHLLISSPHCPAPSCVLSPLSRGAEAVLPGVAPLPPSLPTHPFYEFFCHPLLVMSHWLSAAPPPPPWGFRQSTGCKTALAGPSTSTINHSGFTPGGYNDPLPTFFPHLPHKWHGKEV